VIEGFIRPSFKCREQFDFEKRICPREQFKFN